MHKLLFVAMSACGLFLAGAVAQDTTLPAQRSPQSRHHSMPHAHMHNDMRAMNQKMVQALGEADAEYEKRFIDMMIPHHEGAVLMAKDALKKASKPELKKMAEKMIQEQEKEIAMLKAYRAQWYGNP
ncbi:MAG: DUF305 domain-containing protein [Planctomycetaceae bacterium]